MITEDATKKAAIDALKTRKTAIEADADFIALLDKAKNASNAQINSWLTSNVTTLAQARTVLGALIKIVALKL